MILLNVGRAVDFVRSNHNRYLLELRELLSIASISTLPENRQDINRAAEWVALQLDHLGAKREIMETAGHPIVYGEWLQARGRPTVLIYGHYDVQPADPLAEWVSPPFEPTVRGENIFARGVSDMKGQLHAVLKALEAWMKTSELPVNIKIIFEGEEEVGSPNLDSFVEENKGKLQSSYCLNADSSMLSPDLPALVYGLRGLVYFELTIEGAPHDLHSGSFGGLVQNPAHVLCELIAGLHDEEGRVALPGFYDAVRVLTYDERAEIARNTISDEYWKQMAGVTHLYGENEFTPAERVGARPTLEVNGLLSGFVGEGSKTIIPSKALAKLSVRTVPYQDNRVIERLLTNYLQIRTPQNVTWKLRKLADGTAALIDRNTAAMRAAASALEIAYGTKPVFTLEGGSVPVVTLLKERLGIDSVLMGFSLPDDAMHGPNEKMHLPSYFRGIEAYVHFFDQLAQNDSPIAFIAK
ncbi:MAG: dipeptidase [Candidatus Bathyarchaeia archaeon]